MTDQSTPPQPNEPAARTPDGTLLNQPTTPTDAPAPAADGTLLTPTDPAPADPAAPPAGAPEAYADFTVPEGFTLDKEVAAEAGTLFKGMNLTQDQAQSLVDFYAGKMKALAEAPAKAYADMRTGWQNDSLAHPDLKGKLAAGGPVLTTINRAIDSLGDVALAKDFREAMNLTGAGDHPAFIRTFYKLAERLAEGTPVAGSAPSKHGQTPTKAAPPSAAKAIFPNLS